jgi:hypothetical protein
MEMRTAYCSACDRPVPVLLDPASEEGVRFAPVDASRVICLDYGVRCTGALCPLFSFREDATRLSRSRRPLRSPVGRPSEPDQSQPTI